MKDMLQMIDTGTTISRCFDKRCVLSMMTLCVLQGNIITQRLDFVLAVHLNAVSVMKRILRSFVKCALKTICSSMVHVSMRPNAL